MKIIQNFVRFFVNITISITSLFVFLYYLNDRGVIDYFVFAIPFLVGLIIYFFDKKITGNSKKGIYFFSIVLYFVISALIFLYAMSQVKINFM